MSGRWILLLLLLLLMVTQEIKKWSSRRLDSIIHIELWTLNLGKEVSNKHSIRGMKQLCEFRSHFSSFLPSSSEYLSGKAQLPPGHESGTKLAQPVSHSQVFIVSRGWFEQPPMSLYFNTWHQLVALCGKAREPWGARAILLEACCTGGRLWGCRASPLSLFSRFASSVEEMSLSLASCQAELPFQLSCLPWPYEFCLSGTLNLNKSPFFPTLLYVKLFKDSCRKATSTTSAPNLLLNWGPWILVGSSWSQKKIERIL